ncbi:MAG: hypothetical protein C4547_10510 [Phycisphaerales bacterium]|nr:MAG: hypothetical protein C4547_10510 [Phycisphaerales bacterium]
MRASPSPSRTLPPSATCAYAATYHGHGWRDARNPPTDRPSTAATATASPATSATAWWIRSTRRGSVPSRTETSLRTSKTPRWTATPPTS